MTRPPGSVGDECSNSGAYCLLITLTRPAIIVPGRLGKVRLEAGRYCYVGSARRGLRQRVARHLRTAQHKPGSGHWHIDALLSHRYARIADAELLPGSNECAVSRTLAETTGVSVPVRGFGATDCRAGCAAHLYQLSAA